MKKFILLLAVLLVCSIVPRVHAQQADAMPPEQKAWMDYMTPGPMHDVLKANEGKWKVTTTMYMKPGVPPQTSEGESNAKMILGGRYLQSEFHGTAMGGPYEGMGLDAYDNALGEFRSIWIDNMGTGVMMMHGKMDPTTKVISYEGRMVDPQSKTEVDCWSTGTIVDADHQTMEMYTMVEGQKFKMMEMKYERVK
jgi:hypothetical protein